MTFAGRAQTAPVMKTTCSGGMPAWTVKAQKPTKESIRITAGRLKIPRAPVRNQARDDRSSSTFFMSITRKRLA
jgi:hypothetical protein